MQSAQKQANLVEEFKAETLNPTEIQSYKPPTSQLETVSRIGTQVHAAEDYEYYDEDDE